MKNTVVIIMLLSLIMLCSCNSNNPSDLQHSIMESESNSSTISESATKPSEEPEEQSGFPDEATSDMQNTEQENNASAGNASLSENNVNQSTDIEESNTYEQSQLSETAESDDMKEDAVFSDIADYPYYENILGIAQQADAIVKCSVVPDSFREDNINIGEGMENTQYTIYAMRVSKVFKGTVVSETEIEIKQMGGINTNPEIMQFTEGTEYILFLMDFGSIPFSLVHPTQGIYSVVDGEILPHDNSTIELSVDQLTEILASL